MSFSDHRPIGMLSLLPLFALNSLFSALKKKTSLLLTNPENGEIFHVLLSVEQCVEISRYASYCLDVIHVSL